MVKKHLLKLLKKYLSVEITINYGYDDDPDEIIVELSFDGEEISRSTTTYIS